MPPAWHHSASAVSRIGRGQRIDQTGDFYRCLSVQSAQIKASDHVCGSIEVGDTKRFEFGDEGPFLLEEHLLLDTIATRIGTLIG